MEREKKYFLLNNDRKIGDSSYLIVAPGQSMDSLRLDRKLNIHDDLGASSDIALDFKQKK